MTHEQFEILVRRLEVEARRSPRAYRLRVVALAVLGYAYIGAILAVLVGILGGLAYLATFGRSMSLVVKGGWALGYVAWVIGRSLWVRLPPPGGIPLKESASPALFECVEELRKKLRGPRLHQILLRDDFNAAVVQHPRLGVLGWQKNYLILGLPYLQAASLEEFRAVLGHELGHLSGNHSKLAAWVYRVRASWSQLASRLEEEEHWSRFVFQRFFHWYAPFFAAWSFVLARSDEFDADRASAEVTSPEVAGDSLVGGEVRARFVHGRFWPAIYANADGMASPDAVNPFELLPDEIRSIDAADAQAWLDAGLAEETTVDDTHPCLRERLQSLGVAPRIPPAPDTPAAKALLGKALSGLMARTAEIWRFEAAEWWNERYQHVKQARKRLGELASAAEHTELPPDEAWERAQLTEELEGAEAALPLYRGLVEEDLDDSSASFALGRLLLAAHDDAGLVHLDRAMERSDAAVVPGCELACRYLRRSGCDAEARTYWERGVAQQELLDRDHHERNTLPYGARYLYHDLDDETLHALRAALAERPVKRAWLVRKELEVFPDRPLYVLGVERDVAWWRTDAEARGKALQDELVNEVDLPGEAYVLALNGRAKRDWKMFTETPGARILPA